jgi:hypothetical protein
MLFTKRPVALFAALFCCAGLNAQSGDTSITVHWDKVVRVSQTCPTLQVGVNPPLRRGNPVHDHAFRL